MEKGFFPIIITLIMVLSLFNMVKAAEEDQVFFSITDPTGDDYGPGTYKYPTNEVFRFHKGLFDITGFSVKRDGEDYLLRFSLKKLTNPWKGKFGFSLPLIQLYIDNQEGGSTELFKEGANVRLDPRYPWDRLLKISGWWVRAYQPEDRNKEVNFWNAEENPWDVSDARVEVEGNDILVRLKGEVTGKMENARVYLIVGSFDPFGPDHFRSVERELSSWSFADLTHDNLDKAPRVIDLVLPANRDQAEVLGDFVDDYPLIYPFQIRESGNMFISLNKHLYFLLLLIIPLVIVVRKYWRNV